MTITLEVSDEIAYRLAADARKAGLTIDQLVLRSIAKDYALAASGSGPAYDPFYLAACANAVAAGGGTGG